MHSPTPPHYHRLRAWPGTAVPDSTPGFTPGFTLFEIITVIILLGVLSAVVVPRLLETEGFDLRAETDVLANHLRYAQAMAMGTLAPCGIAYTAGSPARYHLFRSSAPATALVLPGEQGTTVSLPSGMSVAFSTGNNVVSFTAKGVPCSDNAGAVPLTADAVLTVSLGGDSETVTITQQTGFIP